MRGDSGDGSGETLCHIFHHSPLMIDIIWYNDTMIQWCDVCQNATSDIHHSWLGIPNNIYIYNMIEKTYYGYLSHNDGIPWNPIEKSHRIIETFCQGAHLFSEAGLWLSGADHLRDFRWSLSEISTFDVRRWVFWVSKRQKMHLTRSVFSFRCV